VTPEQRNNLESWKAEYDNCRSILKTLVDLKELKDKYGKTALYNERQPLAWDAAKKFLENYQHESCCWLSGRS
jgi:hypothetical protein